MICIGFQLVLLSFASRAFGATKKKNLLNVVQERLSRILVNGKFSRNEKMKELIEFDRFSVGLTAALLRGTWSNPKGKNQLFSAKERLSGLLGYDRIYADILQE